MVNGEGEPRKEWDNDTAFEWCVFSVGPDNPMNYGVANLVLDLCFVYNGTDGT